MVSWVMPKENSTRVFKQAAPAAKPAPILSSMKMMTTTEALTMARRIAYVGEPVLTLDQVAVQCRLEPEDLQPELIQEIIIPGVVGQAESRSGAAIRLAEYEDEWPEHYGSGHALDVGQAKEVISISRILSDGSEEVLTSAHYLRVRQRESFLYFPEGDQLVNC